MTVPQQSEVVVSKTISSKLKKFSYSYIILYVYQTANLGPGHCAFGADGGRGPVVLQPTASLKTRRPFVIVAQPSPKKVAECELTDGYCVQIIVIIPKGTPCSDLARLLTIGGAGHQVG